ncbi:neuropeptide receptor myosuppressin [Megachile rotundata]|uniref:neuropeptide receptor myosuppressin n=1 Tax=Megachile rotundata TaxID=143995 RepID=UPI003FD5F604
MNPCESHHYRTVLNITLNRLPSHVYFLLCVRRRGAACHPSDSRNSFYFWATDMGSTVMICFLIMTMAVVYNVSAALPTQCSPGFLDDLPPRIRKVCAALSRIYELGSEMESYIDEKENHITGFHENIPLLDSGVKRQDVDHVFLRFGKRR